MPKISSLNSPDFGRFEEEEKLEEETAKPQL